VYLSNFCVFVYYDECCFCFNETDKNLVDVHCPVAAVERSSKEGDYHTSLLSAAG